jgi:hypothetical protein
MKNAYMIEKGKCKMHVWMLWKYLATSLVHFDACKYLK